MVTNIHSSEVLCALGKQPVTPGSLRVLSNANCPLQCLQNKIFKSCLYLIFVVLNTQNKTKFCVCITCMPGTRGGSPCLLVHWRQSLWCFPVADTRQTGLQTSPWRSSRVMDLSYLDQFLTGYGDQNSGPRVCIASILSIEPIPCPSVCF